MLPFNSLGSAIPLRPPTKKSIIKMKTNYSILTTAAAALIGLSSSSMAASWIDADQFGISIAPGVGNAYASSFDLVNADGTSSFLVNASNYSPFTQQGGQTFTSVLGYTPGESILGGEMAFWFRDTLGDSFTINLDLATDFNIVTGGPQVVVGQSLTVSVIASLEADGAVNYTVTNGGPNNITFDYAVLRADTANVPDGGTTLALLGSAIIGLGLLHSKRRAA